MPKITTIIAIPTRPRTGTASLLMNSSVMPHSLVPAGSCAESERLDRSSASHDQAVLIQQRSQLPPDRNVLTPARNIDEP